MGAPPHPAGPSGGGRPRTLRGRHTMYNLMRDAWEQSLDVAITIATGALDGAATLYAAMLALPLPFALMAVAAGVALFHTIDQHMTRRDQ